MKITNKIICFLSVLVLCFPLFSPVQSVSANETVAVGNPLKDCLNSLSNYQRGGSESYLQDSYNSSFIFFPYDGWRYLMPFEEYKDNLHILLPYSSTDSLTSDNLYYISFSKGDSLSDYEQLILYSQSPIKLYQNNDFITYTSDTTLYYGWFHLSEYNFLKSDSTYFKASPAKTSSGYSAVHFDFSKYIPIKYNSSTSSLKSFSFSPRNDNTSYSEITFDRVYSNCGKIDTILLPNVTDSDLKPISKFSSDQIEVKLTPQFGSEMDRVFDPLTGQNDYFKFEVTNNSDVPIQFSASIVPPGTELFEFIDLYNPESLQGNLGDYLYGEQKFLNSKALWNYLTDCEYYIINSQIEFEKLYFVKNTNFYVEERKGNFYWIFVPPNTTYSDYIYWENIKISPNTHYELVFTGFKLNSSFVHSSAVFTNAETLYALSNTKDDSAFSLFKSNTTKPWTVFGNVNTDSSIDQYRLELNDMVELYRQDFSVKTIPSFSSEIRGGNSSYSTGWKDTEVHVNNPYYKKNLQTGEIEAISNWSEYNGYLPDVDLNIDNLSVSDVKGYVSYSQDFFKLIKSVFQFVPAFWVLVVFGLTAIIVIAIIRYIRG